MKRYLILLLCLSTLITCWAQPFSDAERLQMKEAIIRQMTDYPASTLKDVYKNFFQDAFGPGHLMSDAPDAEERMTAYLRTECEEAKTDIDQSPYYVRTGWHGRFYRVNLSVINDGKVPFDTFLRAFVESASDFTLPTVTEWSEEWAEIEQVFVSCGYKVADYETDSKAIQALLAEGKYASHHSRAYNDAYHPHYRLIEKSVFERELLPLINNTMITRISEIEVYPEYLTEYLQAAKLVGQTSVEQEEGVICIYPMQVKRDSCQIRILEIYADEAAYKRHIQTAHFQTYKQGTLHMVKHLDLVDCEPMNPGSMKLIFKK